MIKYLTILIFLTALCPAGTHKVTRIVDGDTIEVEGYDKPIRILGIDTFESRRNKQSKKQAKRIQRSEKEVIHLGKVATAKAKKVLLNRCVELQSDYKDKGYYGRPLRYVFLPNLDYQEFMLQEGLALSYCGDKNIIMYEKYNELSKFKCR